MTAPRDRRRLDQLLVDRGLIESRQKAQACIRAGQVRVAGQVQDKPGLLVRGDAVLALEAPPRFVSRGGEKLAAALAGFGVVPRDRVCADLGASTGGFTDCLLQEGARRVYAIDVGYGQLAWSLRQDPRVVVMERTNVRHLEALPEPVDLLVGDLSFIGLEKVLPAVIRIGAPGAEAVLLVKPQFEVGRENVGRGGLVRDEAARLAAVEAVALAARGLGCAVLAQMVSPLPGAKAGNIEHLLHLRLPERRT